MRLKLFSLLILALSFAGCATTRGPGGSDDQVQARIGELEQKLDQKDEEINDLKDEVQSLSDDVRKKDPSASSSRKSSSRESDSASSSDDGYKKDGTVRVNVDPSKVQLALKNAGYYSGTVDGRIGDKTKKAVAEFQKAHNLHPDGIVGKKTWDELKTYLE